MGIIKPPRLRKGELIGLIAPASTPSSEEKILKGALYLEKMGYRVQCGRNVRTEYGYLAGGDDERSADFNAMVSNKNIKAIFAIRGGYGTPRLLQKIDYHALRKNPKIIVGYSDLTALQLAIFRKIGLITFSGPMTGVEMWRDFDPYTEEHFWRMLTSNKKIGVLNNPASEPLAILRHGQANGRLIGGNLSLLACLMGTPFLPVLRNSILIAEDVEESPHRIDRMLAQLLNAGILNNLQALIFGKFIDCTPSNPNDPHLTIDQVLEEYTHKIGCPVVANFQYGHIPRKLTVPFGLKASINTKRRRIEIPENGVL
jgi:muramoyltetrapeptide carboxypeptidase